MKAGESNRLTPAPSPADSWETLHGVFLEVMDLGVLIRGPSGSGKSTLALELISRGARLIADDAPEFRHEGNSLYGHCPPLLQDYLEVRHLGLLDIRSLYGTGAVCEGARLGLLIELTPPSETTPPERLGVQHPGCELLGVTLPSVQLPVASGSSLAVMVEAAARRQILYYNGHDFTKAFSDRQARQLQDPSE